MINQPLPKHVFVSYSRADEAVVNAIIKALQSKGITIWIDQEGLTVGTPNWNTAIRTALGHSFAVLFMASPHAGQSNAVFGELEVARDFGCPIYPLWIAGDKWSACAPVEMVYAQRIDCRGNSYDPGLAQVAMNLHQLIANYHLPKHCRYTGEYLRSLQELHLPSDYLRIHLNDPHFFFQKSDSGFILYSKGSPETSSDIVIMLPKAYQSIRPLLDDLYMGYLSERYKKYAYGMEWMLGKELTFSQQKQLIVPWKWLEEPSDRPLAEWKDASPKSYDLSPGQELIIIDGPFENAFGVATNDGKVAAILADNTLDHQKEKIFLLEYLLRKDVFSPLYLPQEIAHIHPRLVPPNEVNTSAYSYYGVFTSDLCNVNKVAFIIE